MRLTDALRVSPGQAVAFVGAGGKSSALSCLARELSRQVPVVMTCTTHLGLEQSSLAEVHFAVSGRDQVWPLEQGLARKASVLVTGPLDLRERKWTGLRGELLDEVRRAASAAGGVILIEADGARRRSLKAPAAHEPVIPPFATSVVPVVGLDAVGVRLDHRNVHRPERVAALLGVRPGVRLKSEHIARLLAHPEGGLKDVPAGAEVRPLMTRADDEERLRTGEDVAEVALRMGPFRALVIANLTQEDSVRRVVGRTSGVVLAAGGSRRLDQPKQLLAWRGRPLVWYAVRAAIEGGLDPVVVVVGAEWEAVAAAVADEPVRVVRNPAWQSGQSTSLRVGLAAVEGTAEAVVFLLADTPRVDGRLVRALVEAHRRSLPPLVAPRAGGRLANPVLFDRVTFGALAEVEGDRGGRVLFDRLPVLALDWSDDILLDVDTPEDLACLRGAG